MTMAQKRRAEAREALRLKCKGAEYLRQIAIEYDRLTALQKEVEEAKNTKAKPMAVATTIDKADCQVRIIRVKMDTNFRRLAKVLPDLKAIELTDEDGKNPLGTLADALREAVRGASDD